MQPSWSLPSKYTAPLLGRARLIGRGWLRGVRQQEVQLELVPPCKCLLGLHRSMVVLSVTSPVCSACICALHLAYMPTTAGQAGHA